MKYEKLKKSLEERIEELKQIRDLLDELEDTAMRLEREVSEMDDSLPSDRDIARIKDRFEKKEINDILNLLDEAYSITDSILGRADMSDTDEPAGTAFSPEARGTSNVSIDEVLNSFHISGKNIS